MPIRLRPPGGDKTFPAAIFLFGGVLILVLGLLRSNPFLVGLGIIFSIAGGGLWFDQPWARWFTAVALIAFSSFSGVRLFTKGFDWVRLGSFLAPIWTAWQVWKDFAPVEAEQDEAEEEKKPDGPEKTENS